MRWLVGLATAALASLSASCHPGLSGGGYPLYPKVGGGPGRDKVSFLRGQIAYVDGNGVRDKGTAFELLPGCHVVQLARSVGDSAGDGAWSAHLRRFVFAFEMKPAHTYTVDVRFEGSSSMYGRVFVVAQEHAPDGSAIRVPVARGSDVDDCRNWAKSQGL
jgi:hypothetical protein